MSHPLKIGAAMNANPLSREERERDTILCGQRWIARPNARDGYILRYEATVQAAEERAERLRAALEAIEAYTGGEPVYHRTFGDSCDEDACAVCLIEGTAGQALAADDAARGES